MQFSLPCSKSTNNGMLTQILVTIFNVNCHNNDTEFLELLGATIVCTVQESIFKKIFLKASIGPIQAYAFLNRTTEQNSTSHCPYYTYLPNPHSEVQPDISPLLFFILSFFPPILYLKYQRE